MTCRKCGGAAWRWELCTTCAGLLAIAYDEEASELRACHYRVRWSEGCYEVVESATGAVILATHDCGHAHAFLGTVNAGVSVEDATELTRPPAPREVLDR